MTRGFTLLELVTVLALMGLIATLSATALTRSGSTVDRAGERLVTRLLDARVIAMRSGAPATFVLRTTETGLESWIEAGDERSRERVWDLPGVEMSDETETFTRDAPPISDRLRARYEPSGRTDRQRWIIAAGGRMQEVRFDPITGVPALHRVSAER